MGGIIRHAKAVVARSLDNVERHEIAKASKSAIELVDSDQDIHNPVVYNFLKLPRYESRRPNFLQLPRYGSRRPSIDEELNTLNSHPSVFIRLNNLVDSSWRSSFTDVSRRSSVFSRLSDLINSSRRPSVILISRAGSIYERFSRYSEASIENQVHSKYPSVKHRVIFLGVLYSFLFVFIFPAHN